MSATVNPSSAQEKLRPSLAAESTASSPMVCLDHGEFGLLVPTRDLVSLLAPQQLVSQPEQPAEACGSLDFDGHWYAVFCINKALQLQPSLKEKHRVIVLLRTQGYGFGIACSALTKLESELKAVYPVPPSMRSRKQPFTEFTLIDNQATGLSSAAALLGLLKLRGVKMLPLQNSQAAVRKGAG